MTNVLNIKKDFYTKHYITHVFRSNSDYLEHNVCKGYGNIIVNNTDNITKHINNQDNDVTNNYQINKISNVRKTSYNFNDDVTLNKTSNKCSNDTYNLITTNNTFDTAAGQYFTKEINTTSHITNDITRHNHNNCEHNVIKKVSKPIKHISNDDIEIN